MSKAFPKVYMNLIILFSTVAAYLVPQHPLTTHYSTLGTISWCNSPQDIFTPHNVTLIPDPPKRGEKFTIYIQGNLKEPVDQGSFAKVKVRLGFIQLIDQTYDICEQVTQVGKQCPLEGDLVIEHQVDIPREVPPGRYRVHVEAYLENQSPVTCLDADFRM